MLLHGSTRYYFFICTQGIPGYIRYILCVLGSDPGRYGFLPVRNPRHAIQPPFWVPSAADVLSFSHIVTYSRCSQKTNRAGYNKKSDCIMYIRFQSASSQKVDTQHETPVSCLLKHQKWVAQEEAPQEAGWKNFWVDHYVRRNKQLTCLNCQACRYYCVSIVVLIGWNDQDIRSIDCC